MRIAIVGAGLAGLALCSILSKVAGVEVVLFDAKGIGKGASGVSTGLLHPFPGKHAALSRYGKEAFVETLSFLQEVEEKLKRKIHTRCGIFRPAVTEEQRNDFQKRDETGLVDWMESHSIYGSGLWIPDGSVVFMRSYLDGLWELAEAAGAKFQRMEIFSLFDLQAFDQVVLTTGFETEKILECKGLKSSKTKGQALLCRVKETIPFALASNGHIAPTEDPHLVLVGSTYERKFTHLEPDPEVALQLLQQVSSFYKEALQFEVIE